MFKTPLTRLSANRIKQQSEVVEHSVRRANSARASLKRSESPLVTTPSSFLIWSYAAGVLMGSRRKVTKVVERPTKTIKNSPSLLSVISTTLSVLALKYRTEAVLDSHVIPESDSDESKNL